MKAFGDILRNAREAMDVSVTAVAESTRIQERYLHAIERNDLDALPGGIFDKGYIKAYAQFLDLDPEPLLESYAIEEAKRGVKEDELEKLSNLVDARRAPSRRPRGGHVSPRRVVLFAVSFAVLLGASWIALRGLSPSSARETSGAARPDEAETVRRSLSVQDPVSELAEPTPEESMIEESAPEETPDPPRAAVELVVAETGVGTGVVDRDLTGKSDRFPAGTQVWFWTRILGGGEGVVVRHVWLHGGRVHMNAELPVPGGHWRTYSTLELPPATTGEWTLEVRSADGTVLATQSFECVSPGGT